VGPASGPSRPARHRTAVWLASTGIAALLATGAAAETIDSEVTVPGTRPSPFIVAGDLTVGAVTSGSLQIVDGGDVANANGTVGAAAGATGYTRVNGAGSTWTNSGSLTVGGNGTGTVDVVSQGALTSNGASIGLGAGSTGAVTVDREGTWTNAGALTVGGAGTGTLNATASGKVTSGSVSVGSSGGSGTVFVKGQSSSVSTVGPFLVNDGTVAIEGGGTVSSGSTALGVAAGSGANVRVQDAGSRWVSTGAFDVARSGSASVRVESGGAISSASSRIADGTGSTGSVVVTGTGSTWTNTGDLVVGRAGNAALTVEGGGTVNSGAGSIGISGTSSAKVTGTGSSWTSTSGLSIGSGGNGDLTVEAGGQVNNTTAVLGDTVAGKGTVRVTGAGARWTSSGTVEIGRAGQGTLTVDAGGIASSGGARIGGSAGLESSAVVSGTGSEWRNTGSLDVGAMGRGTLAVSNSGGVRTTAFRVGAEEAGIGTASVTGTGSFLVTQQDLVVGGAGRGTMSITAGATATAETVIVGQAATGNGTLTVSGVDSRLTSSSVVVGGAGAGSLTVAAGGTLDAERVVIAQGAASTGALNIGSASTAPSEAVAAGTLTAKSIAFGAGAGVLNLNHSETALDIDADISGRGTIRQIGGTTVLSGDSEAFTGTARVTGGTLRVNGALGGSVRVDEGRLEGRGTVGSTVVDRGTLAPDGIFTVNGDLALGGNATVEMGAETDGRWRDLIRVTGTADLGGTLEITNAPDRYRALTTILTATQVTGEFDELVASFPFLDAELAYTATSVGLSLERNDVAFEDVARTRNQRETARAVGTLAIDGEIYRVVVLSEERARQAFDNLSGEVHASALSAGFADALTYRGAALARLRSLQQEPLAPPVRGPQIALGFAGPIADAPTPYVEEETADGVMQTAFGVWAQALGSWRHTRSDGNAAAMDAQSGGLIAGADAAGEFWQLGFAAGYGYTSLDVPDRTSSAEVQSASATLYGGALLGPVNLRLGGSYGFNAVDTDRRVAIGTFEDRLTASYDGYTAQGFAEIGVPLNSGLGTVEPFLGGAVVRVNGGDFAENGGAAALESVKSDNDLALATLGVRGEWELGLLPGRFNGSVAWQHAFGDVTPERVLAFRAGSAGFEINGVPVDRDQLLVEAELAFETGAASRFGVSYIGAIGPETQSHGVRGRFEARF
jgi:outer membrane autotransporter protein